MDRRTFFKRFAEGIAALAAGVIAIPAALNVFAPLWRRRPPDRWRPLGEMVDFPIGEVASATVTLTRHEATGGVHEKGVYVYRPDAERTVVFSRNCTDLSCPVTHDPGSGWFFCPCHGGVFNAEGEPVAGPPDRPLYRYALRVREGMLEIDLDSLPPMT